MAASLGQRGAMPQASLAADARQRVDTGVKAFVTTLGERYDSEIRRRENVFVHLLEDIADAGVTEHKLTATNPRAAQKFGAQSNCKVAAHGHVIGLRTDCNAAH